MSREQRRIADQERPTATCQRLKIDPDHICNYLQVSHPLGRKVQERWMWIWSCELTHMGKLKNNEKDLYLAYSQATEEEIKESFPKTYGLHLIKRDYLNKLYGIHGRRKEGTSGS